MQLLPQTEVTKRALGEEAQIKETVQQLYDLETELIKRVNDARENADKEMAQIESDLATFRKEKAEEKSLLSKLLDWFKEEVSKLEARRRDAMLPVEELRKEAEDRIAQVAIREEKVWNDEITNKNDLSELVERTQELVGREERVSEKEKELDKRENRVQGAETKAQLGIADLNLKWVEYHKTVNATNADIERREKEIEDGKKANDIYKQSLDERAKELFEKDREITNNRAVLDVAWKAFDEKQAQANQ